MKVILSPAMNMENCYNASIPKSLPKFNNRANNLAKELKKLSPFELESLLGISSKLVDKVFENYCNFECDTIEYLGAQALVAFTGLAYKNLDVDDFTKEDFDFANETLRILSALYGILKPYDLIQQYRLDFMCDFAKKENLYGFWGNDIYNEVFKDNELVIAICSKEYEKLIKPFLKPHNNYYSCEFLIYKNGKYKAFATASKMARGQMARYIVKNKIDDLEKIKEFEYDGFVFSVEYSTSNTLAFIKSSL